MNYLWTEDTGAGLHFWNLVNQIFFDDKLIVESKKSNQGILDAVSNLELKKEDKYYIAFDYIVDNQDIRNKYRLLKLFARKSDGQIIILDMICFEYLVLAFEKLVQWTGTGKTDKIQIRKEILSAIENHKINLEKIKDGKTLKYLTGFKKYSTERVMKSLAGELTENEKSASIRISRRWVLSEMTVSILDLIWNWHRKWQTDWALSLFRSRSHGTQRIWS